MGATNANVASIAKIPVNQLKEIARLFWLLVPAERAARDMGVNRKTIQKYYQLLRKRIAEEDNKDALSWTPRTTLI